MSHRRAAPAARITRRFVPPLVPAAGPIHTVLIGEAPGPRGADQSLVPFWGDAAGRLVYRALAEAGCVEWDGPANAWELAGCQLAARSLFPRVTGVLLTNAYDVCPTDDGQRFRAPSRAELRSMENESRLRRELSLARERGCVQVVTLGRVAATVVAEQLEAIGADQIAFVRRPHPSAQGLLMAAPGRGAGMRLAELEKGWVAELVALLEAGAGQSGVRVGSEWSQSGVRVAPRKS